MKSRTPSTDQGPRTPNRVPRFFARALSVRTPRAFNRKAALFAGIAAMVLAFGASPAWAAPTDDDRARAKEIFLNGQTLFKEGRYEDASIAFQEAYRLSEEPALLYNLAACAERLGKFDAAIDHLNRYRVYATADERVELERRIVNLERRRDETPTPTPVAPTPEPAPSEGFGRAGKALAITGGSMMVVFGSVQLYSWSKARAFAESGDEEAWSQLQPLNLTSGALTIAGGGLFVTGLVLGAQGVSSDGTQISIGPNQLVIRGRF